MGSYSNNGYTYDYTCKITANPITFTTGDNVSSIESITCALIKSGNSGSTNNGNTTTDPEGTPYGDPVTITATNDWSHTFTNLPLTGTDESGNTVNYYYYVVETPVTNYDVSYDNNSGIQSGKITVTNKATDNPEYVLPETGGGGSEGYTIGGFLLTSGAALWLFCRRKRRREAV